MQENLKLIEKLKEKANISYEDAKDALENSDWDILDAMIYLEKKGKIKRPSTSTFYTNENKDTYSDNYNLTINNKEDESRKNKDFQGVFEAICKAIDTCNNIFLEISKEGNIFLKIPMTVLIVLLLFTFGIVIPLFIIGLFFEIEFSISARMINTDKANKVFKEISLGVKKVKEEIKKGFKHD